MRAKEFIVEDNESRTEEFHGVHMKIRDDGYEVVASALDDWGREMGSVVFNKGDGNELDPQDLLVIDKFRGQGIAKVMYDYVKSKGYEIHKSYDVTKIADQGKESGEYFWQKNRGEERVWEAFDNPYKTKSEKSEYGDVDMLAKLPDGTNLSIMFNNQGDDEWQVEFYRNNSQEVTGEGDAQRVFATVLTSMQKFIKKYKPWRLTFSANKDVQPGQNSESRAKLYNRLVQRYATAWGYEEYAEDHGDQITYELTRLKPSVAEDNDKSKDPIANAILDFYQHVGDIKKEPVDNYVGTAKEMLGQVNDPTLKSKMLDIFKQAKENPYVQGGVVTTIGALLAGGVLSSAQKMGLNPAQTNLALQAILNTVIPTVVSRINGKSWSDTIKYTLASAGIGTGIAGMMEESRGLAPTKPYDDLMANMGYFMSLNTVKIQQDAVDSNAQQELANMQQNFRKPILNGMSFFDVNRDVKLSKNPKVAPILLKYVYDMLGYIEPRIKKYIKPDQQGKYLDRLNQIKNDYRAAVAQVS